jgi:hypothetical protein
VWGEDLSPLEARIERYGHNGPVRTSVETYLIVPSNPAVNPKIRGGKLDVKVLVQVLEGCEQWEPRFKEAFPIGAETLQESFFPLVGLAPPPLRQAEYTRDEVLEGVVGPHPGLVAVRIRKHRRGFAVDGCLAEVATVDVGERSLQTVAIEGEHAEEVVALGDRIGVLTRENLSYPAQICRLSEAAL